MLLSHPEADLFIPDIARLPEAASRTSHLGIMAHQDDLEISAYHGIAACFDKPDLWFGGVIMTNGAGCPRGGHFANHTDVQMREVRAEEQRKAAAIGQFSFVAQLAYPSSDLKDPGHGQSAANDLTTILLAARPQVVYLHNPVDRHDTHVACCLRAIEALRSLPREIRPKLVYGCEGWRKLDWLLTPDKVALDVSAHRDLAKQLLVAFDSQISGGKRYDRAEEGLRHANATYYDSHTLDPAEQLSFAMDLTPLIENDAYSINDFALGFVNRLHEDVAGRLIRNT
jgi:LmbE family N-acetylglucosaminyl deacetylase